MNRLGYMLLFGVLLLFSLYLPINVERVPLYNFKTFVDDYIPLLTFFIIIYVSYGVFLIFVLLYFIKKSKPQILNEILLSIIISCLVAYVIYLLFQNYIQRPMIDSNNIFDAIYTWGNSWIASYNAFPSLHVAITTVCVIGFNKIKSRIFKPILIWGILIIISTVLTKQHYFLDVLSGLILGFLSFKTSGYLLNKYIFKSAKIHQ